MPRARASEPVACGLAQQRAGDHEPLDLARPLVDLGDLRVAVVALGGELLRIAVAAQHLDRLAGLASRDGTGEELGLRALDGVRAARLLEARSAVSEGPGGLDLGLHLGKLVLDRLEAPDRSPEGAPLPRIADREVERRLRDARGLGSDADAPAV